MEMVECPGVSAAAAAEPLLPRHPPAPSQCAFRTQAPSHLRGGRFGPLAEQAHKVDDDQPDVSHAGYRLERVGAAGRVVDCQQAAIVGSQRDGRPEQQAA